MQRPAPARRIAARGAALTAAAVAAAALVIGIGGRSVSLAATSVCQTSTSPLFGYSVTVCVTVPDGNLSGVVPVSATVEVTGSNKRQIQRGIFVMDPAGTPPLVSHDNLKDPKQYLLSDFEAEDTAPNQKTYRMTLDTRRWGDGPHKIGALAFMTDVDPACPTCPEGWPSLPATVSKTFANGFATPPPNPRSFVPKTYEPPAGQPLVVAAVGDGAAGETSSKAVVSLVA
ncbi:MAG: hypothetical protein QOK40_3546, partial [Miltoncostaeaceae bacterium]|nr:hypothetical protein [Miltoncostaeaceae bacterium]